VVTDTISESGATISTAKQLSPPKEPKRTMVGSSLHTVERRPDEKWKKRDGEMHLD
jgi:hypothetical protein